MRSHPRRSDAQGRSATGRATSAAAARSSRASQDSRALPSAIEEPLHTGGAAAEEAREEERQHAVRTAPSAGSPLCPLAGAKSSLGNDARAARGKLGEVRVRFFREEADAGFELVRALEGADAVGGETEHVEDLETVLLRRRRSMLRLLHPLAEEPRVREPALAGLDLRAVGLEPRDRVPRVLDVLVAPLQTRACERTRRPRLTDGRCRRAFIYVRYFSASCTNSGFLIFRFVFFGLRFFCFVAFASSKPSRPRCSQASRGGSTLLICFIASKKSAAEIQPLWPPILW